MRNYSIEEVKEATLSYFFGDTMARDVWMSKYALQDKEGNFKELTPEDTHKRLAKEFARIEKKYSNPISEEEIFSYFDHFKYIIPQGSPMEGIGNDYRLQSLSNCFVIESPADSYGGILKTDQEQAQLMKRRGGVGFDISNIRPKGMQTNNAAKTTDGIGIFMERFSNTTREVAQNGRRGALILSCSVNHPEIERFITIKNDRTKVTGANISVRVNDEFMLAVKNGTLYTQKWPEKNPTIFKEIDAKKLWNLFISNTWEHAEPGILFWDTILKNTPSDIYKDYGYQTTGVNPCLAGDTQIETSQGKITIHELSDNFQKLKNEIYILSYNIKTDQLEYKNLDYAGLTKTNANIIELELEDGKRVKLTPDHKIYTKNRGWIEAAKLTENDILLELDLP
jgi:ribonucleoside-diphosphate reductase alpha chain